MTFTPINVEKEYEKDKNLRREDVQALVDWLEKQPHLPQATELQLVLFLQSCYYRLEAAKSAIENFFTMRTLHPQLFGCPDAENLNRDLNVASINFLPKQTPEGYKVLVAKLLDFRPSNYVQTGQVKVMESIILLELMQKGTMEGILGIIDLKGLTLGHLTRMNLMTFKRHFDYLQEASPLRIKGIHFINVVPFVDKLLALFRPFLKAGLMEVVQIHTDSLESLYKVVPKQCLPEDYGGEESSLAEIHERTKENLLANLDLFRWLDLQRVDESKRLDRESRNDDRIFGTAGSFKRLELD